MLLDPDKPFEEAAQIGLCMSPGDTAINEPYYYITPWPQSEAVAHPELDGPGRWEHKAFKGLLLLSSELLVLDVDTQEPVLRAFLSSAMDMSRPVFVIRGGSAFLMHILSTECGLRIHRKRAGSQKDPSLTTFLMAQGLLSLLVPPN